MIMIGEKTHKQIAHGVAMDYNMWLTPLRARLMEIDIREALDAVIARDRKRQAKKRAFLKRAKA